MILEQTYELLSGKYGSRLENLRIKDVRIGAYLTAVRLSDGSTGTSTTLTGNHPVCSKHNRDFGEFTPLNIRGRKVKDILESKKTSGIVSSIRTAVLNAVSLRLIAEGDYRIIEDCDPADLLDLKPRKTITIVGGFQSYIQKIAKTGNDLYVLELSEEALTSDQKKYYMPAGEYRTILPLSDIVIITGQTLVNRTIDDLLSVIRPGAQVILTGPSSGLIPDVLFENKVSIIGTIRITDPEVLFDIVCEGGTGFHLFEYCAEKICIMKNDEAHS